MAGYNGYSMSNNAVAAYADGEMPLSKWTRVAIFEAIAERREQLRKAWEPQGYTYGLEHIEDDAFIETYIR